MKSIIFRKRRIYFVFDEEGKRTIVQKIMSYFIHKGWFYLSRLEDSKYVMEPNIPVINYIKKKVPTPVRISIGIFILFICVVGVITIITKGYRGDFLRGVLVESYGMLFDILIIGIIILWLNEIRRTRFERELEIKRYINEIEDFLGWRLQVGTIRILGNIKRLNNLGVTDINLSDSYLKNADFGKYVHKIIPKDEGYQFIGIQLQNAHLNRTNLQGANFRGVNLDNAYLAEANLKNVKNLTIEQLANVQTLYNAKLDDELLKLIKKSHPNLIEKPEYY